MSEEYSGEGKGKAEVVEGGSKDANAELEPSDSIEISVSENNDDINTGVSIPRHFASMVVSATQSEGPSKNQYNDHFTLAAPSSTVRFRGSTTSAHVYDTSYSQFVIEDNGGDLTAKRMSTTTASLKFLRATYTIVCLFFTGFLLVFCVQLLLYLFQDVTIEMGATSKQSANVEKAIGAIFSIPVFVFGLASALVIAGHYVIDTWAGHPLVKSFVFGGVSEVTTAWITFFFFLGCPLLVMCITTLAGLENWWEITALMWFSFVGLFYLFFAATVCFFEVRACLEIIRNQFDDDDDSFFALLNRSILLRQLSRYSGKRSKVYIARGTLENPTGEGDHTDTRNVQYHTGWYARFTQWKLLTKLGLFEIVPEPGDRTYTIQDTQAIRPFVTYTNWSLEKLYCRPRNSRFVAVIKGPSALTRAQMRSSLVCTFVGDGLVLLIIISILVWMDISWSFIIVVVVLVCILWIPTLLVNHRVWVMTKHIIGIRTEDKKQAKMEETTEQEETGNDDTKASTIERPELGESEGIFQVWERYRVSRATVRLCWIMFAIEISALFLYPLIILFWAGNYPIGLVFLFIGTFSGIRYYLNAAVVLEEVGHMHFVRGKTERKKWKNRSRLNDIVTNVSRSRSQGVWNTVLLVFVFVFVALFLGAVGQGSDTPNNLQLNYLPDFVYEQEDDLRYTTCKFGKGLESSPSRLMADYAFLAGIAYRNENITQSELDQWFGPGNSTDRPEIVSEFQNLTSTADTAVSYKLITFGNFAIVAIRGTTNAWDMLSDAQLWSAAACFQILRAILPIGEIWTPILSQLVLAISYLQAESIKKVSFYKETTAFVRYLQRSGDYANVQVTGHSLGGGLAIITGAQTGAAAVALSGPNAKISRRTFKGVTVDKLNSKVFNIIPDRDPVAMIDDPAQLFQRISCTADSNNFVDCHTSTRSLCEIIHTCGTGNRPALCECVTDFGYPEPIPTGNRTFAEACGVAS